MKHNRKGFTLIELLVVMSIIALLLSILVPALGRARAQAMLLKDATQVGALAKGFNNWSADHQGSFPIPGLEQRLPDINLGHIPGVGPEDISLNDHGSMLSMCIMNNLFGSALLVAPTEPNGMVYDKEDYDYDYYDPSPNEWHFWDDSFDCKLSANVTSGEECNNSYGILPLTGEHRLNSWHISGSKATTAILLGQRGPLNGVYDPQDLSLSFQFHGVAKQWKGPAVFGDTHTEVLDTFYPLKLTYFDGEDTQRDNIFLEDTEANNPIYGSGPGSGFDVVLTHIGIGELNLDGEFGGVANDPFRHD